MAKKFMVTRIMSVLQATAIKANSSSEAIEASRKLKQKDWKIVDNKRRKNYKAEEVTVTDR